MRAFSGSGFRWRPPAASSQPAGADPAGPGRARCLWAWTMTRECLACAWHGPSRAGLPVHPLGRGHRWRRPDVPHREPARMGNLQPEHGPARRHAAVHGTARVPRHPDQRHRRQGVQRAAGVLDLTVQGGTGTNAAPTIERYPDHERGRGARLRASSRRRLDPDGQTLSVAPSLACRALGDVRHRDRSAPGHSGRQ